jgi:transglutaminase-like putative cysteine protease
VSDATGRHDDQDQRGILLRMLGWILRKIGPRTLLIFGLLFVVLASVAGGIRTLIFELYQAPLVYFTFLSMTTGWFLARSRLAGGRAGLITIPVGLAVILVDTAHLGIKLLALAQAVFHVAWQFLEITGASIVSFIKAKPVSEVNPVNTRLVSLLVQDIVYNLAIVLGRTQTWIGGLLHGNSSFDRVAAIVIWGMAIWTVAAWAAWFVRRRSQPLVGVLPAAVLLVACLAFTGQSALVLAPVTFCAFMLSAICNLDRQQNAWQSSGLDYAEDIDFDLGMWSTSLVGGIVIMAFIVSTISPQKTIQGLRKLAQGRSENISTIGESLGLESAPAANVPAAQTDPGVLPRQHLLGSGPELSQEIVMIVQVEGAQATTAGGSNRAPDYYWRGLTYDVYTGRGWATSATQSNSYRAGQIIRTSLPPGYSRIRQRIEWINTPFDTLYYTGLLVSADLNFEVNERPASQIEDDLFAAVPAKTPSGNLYHVDSLALQVGLEQLRTAGREYPQWVIDRYLQLPENLPPRLVNLAKQITTQATTPFDQALAIEHFLRQFPYNLEIPTPPPDRDVADYFLFDLQQGYCDYYATAMVVLARAIGLPSRLVTGYAPGSYDPHTGQFVVTADNAHSWIEVYFPGSGWIEFEPTSSRPEIARPESLTPSPAVELEKPSPAARQSWKTVLIWLGWIAALIVGLSILALLLTLIDAWRLRRLEPQRALLALYQRMYRHGQRLAVPLPPGETPHEFVGDLSQRVNELSLKPRWQKALTPAQQEASDLVDGYTRSIYGTKPAGKSDREQALLAWRGLGRRLWLARWLKTLHGLTRRPKP